jgi:AcrR family transcriptional regulator
MRRTDSGNTRLLEAAIDLLADGGGTRATVNEICRVAGVRPPALYYHYGNKEGLVAAAVEAASTAWLDELEALVGTGSTLEKRVTAGMQGWRALILDPRSALLLLLRVQLDSAQTSSEIRAALVRVMARAKEVIADAIEGVAGPLDDRAEFAAILLDLVQGAALRHHLEDDPASLDRHLAEIGRTIRTLVESREGSAVNVPLPGASR